MLIGTPVTTGCLAMSSYQSARMTEPGPARPMIAISTLGTEASLNSSDRATIWVLDARLRKGVVRDRFDLGLGTSLLGGGLLSLGLEPRLSIVKDVLAVGLPVSFYLGAPFPYSLQWAPGVVLTIPVSRRFEINGAARMMTVYDADRTILRYNIGVAFSDDLRESAIRPEIGIMPGYNDEEWLFQVGVGFEPPHPNAGD